MARGVQLAIDMVNFARSTQRSWLPHSPSETPIPQPTSSGRILVQRSRAGQALPGIATTTETPGVDASSTTRRSSVRARRNLFQHAAGPADNLLNTRTASSFYGSRGSSRETLGTDTTWQPGEIIPTAGPGNAPSLNDGELCFRTDQYQSPMWEDIKSLFAAEFTKFHDHLSQLSDRVCEVEQTVKNLGQQVTDLASEGSLSSSSASSSSIEKDGTPSHFRCVPSVH